MQIFGQEVNDKATFPNEKIVKLRYDLILEELNELKEAINEKNIYFAQTKDYYFMGGWNEQSSLKIFDLKSNLLGTSPDMEYAKNFCKFKKEIK